jgi:sortase A
VSALSGRRAAAPVWGASAEAPQTLSVGRRRVGALVLVAGLLVAAWSLVVWAWQDPLTYVWARLEQRNLAIEYQARAAAYRTSERALADVARDYRLASRPGGAFGRLAVPRLGLDLVVVYGTDTASLRKGPGLDPRSFAPGEGKLAYVAGHRTSYGAPFSRIDELRMGDRVTFRVPYGTFTYAVSGRRIVDDEDLSVLRPRVREELALQACWPRFFASQRIVVYAKRIAVER